MFDSELSNDKLCQKSAFDLVVTLTFDLKMKSTRLCPQLQSCKFGKIPTSGL